MTAFLISQLCASYRRESDFLTKFQNLARRFEGVQYIVVIAAGEKPGPSGPGTAIASAPIRYLGETIGELRLFFDVLLMPNDRALDLAKLLSGQLGMAIQSAAVHTMKEALQGDLAGLDAQLHEHKLLERARGVIESCRLIPTGEGQRLMKKASAQSGKTLRDMANGIVASANRNPWKFRREFWA